MPDAPTPEPAKPPWRVSDVIVIVAVILLYLTGYAFTAVTLPALLVPANCVPNPDLPLLCIDSNESTRSAVTVVSITIWGLVGGAVVVFVVRALRSAARLAAGRSADFSGG